MIRSILGAAGLAAGASAALIRRDQCCFQLTASGGESGTIGQLDDGQNRIGGGLPASSYCLSNGVVTDSHGRGCYVTQQADQIQCDSGASPATGFSISSNGDLEYIGSCTFYACGASTDEYNIYTKPVSGQADCVEVTLSTGGHCSGSSSSASSSAPAYSQTSKKTESTATPYSPRTSQSIASMPLYTPQPHPSAPPASIQSPPSQQSMQPPAPCSESAPGLSPPASAHPLPSQHSPPPAPSYGQSSQPAPSPAPVQSQPSQRPSPSAPAYGQSSQPAPSPAPAHSQPSGPSGSPSAPCPESSQQAPSSVPLQSQPPQMSAQSSAPMYSQPSASTSCESESKSTVHSTVYQTVTHAASTAESTPAAYSTGTPASPSGTTPSLASTCQTSLSGAYQTPHLIVPISSSQPSTAYGTQYNATISSTECTIFNFDIPQSYTSKTCSLVFLFPQQSQLETSAYTFSGSGELTFSSLSGPADEATTWDNCPAKKSELDTFSPQPGNSYVIETGACEAGTTQSVEVCGTGGLELEFFEDWNPSPIGVFITSC